MKTIAKSTIEDNFKNFGQDTLNEQEMNNIRGGGRPITRDKDVWPDEDE